MDTLELKNDASSVDTPYTPLGYPLHGTPDHYVSTGWQIDAFKITNSDLQAAIAALSETESEGHTFIEDLDWKVNEAFEANTNFSSSTRAN